MPEHHHPTQLRSLIRADARDLIGRFRRLAPKRRPVPIQLWDLRRAGITVGLIVSLAAAVAVLYAFVKMAGLPMTPRGGSLRPARRPARWPLAAALAAVLLAAPLTGCATFSGTVPRCGDPLRLAIVAQSVPGAAYIPCIRGLPQGWTTSGFDPARGGTSFLLSSDRAPGRPVTVRLAATCRIGRASPPPPRAPGVFTYTRLTSISPRFAGRLYNVFPSGCVSYSFNFTTGPHIALMEQFEGAIGLYPRQQLRLILKHKLGVELNP